MMMETTGFIVERDGAIARVVLNRPEQLNALSMQTYDDLCRVFGDLDRERDVRVVILSAQGKAFCAGADLRDIKSRLSTPAGIESIVRAAHSAYNAIEVCGKPVVAAVHGLVLAGGLELALACDIVIAAEDARLGDQHAKFGLIPGGGSSQRLPRLIGPRKAKELLLTGNWISAVEAERLGLVNRVVPLDRLEAVADEIARELAQRSPRAARAMKQLVQQGMQVDLPTGLDLEKKAFQAHFTTADVREGLAAFEEKRPPVFTDA